MHPPAMRSAMAKAASENCKRCNQSSRSEPMVEIPSMLLILPVGRKGFSSPSGDSLVDRDRANERKQDCENLDSSGDRRKTPRGLGQMLEREQQQEVQQGGTSHPKRHHPAE